MKIHFVSRYYTRWNAQKGAFNMKKYIALTLALLMSLSLMACGSKTDDGSTDADGSGDQ